MKKSRKIIAGIMAVCLMGGIGVIPESIAPAVSITANAEEASKSGTCGDNLTWVLDDEGTLTISGTGDMESTPWRSVSTSIKKVIIEDGVTNVENYAFTYYVSLIEVTIPNSVTSIGNSAFNGCRALTEITIPDSVTSIGYGAFCCTDLTEITIPNGIKNIADNTFKGCGNLKSITIPDSVTSIGNSAFYGCGLTSIEMSDSITNIGDLAFYSTALTEITISNSVTSIGTYAFNNTPWLESKQKENPFVIVNGILIDGTTCSGDIIIPDDVTAINSQAFYNCENLTSVTLSDSVTSIKNSAFYGCKNLKSIIIPDSVTNIGGGAFGGTSWFESKQAENPLVIVNGILMDATTCSGDVVIPDNVTSISEGAFYGCENLTSITIPNSVISIGSRTFQNCTSLSKVNMLGNVTHIGDRAFLGCKNLTEIMLPESLTYIGTYAFEGTPWFAEEWKQNPFVIINGVLISGDASENVVIPDNATSIGCGAFSWNPVIKSITIPESVTIINENAIYVCMGLDKVIILNPKCNIMENSITNGYDCGANFEQVYFDGTICGYENSTAQEYAEKYGYKFESLGEASTTTDSTITGDANGDNEINMSDAVLIMQSISNPSEYKISDSAKLLADVVDKGDGLTGKDALAIQMIEAKLLSIEDLPITSDEMNSLIK